MAILNLDPNLVLVLAGILVVLGLVLAFFGQGILKKIIGFIGMILGGVIGYLGGSPLVGAGAFLCLGPDTVGGIKPGIAAVAVGGVIFFAGAVFQTMQVRRKKRSAPAIAVPPVVAPPPPPPQ